MTGPRPESVPSLRVGLVIPRLGGGGAEFVALQWASYLLRHGHHAAVITTHDPDGRREDLPVFSIDAPSFLGRAARLRRHLRDHRYDVLIGLMPHWNLLVLLSTLTSPDAPATVISGRNVEAPLRTVHGVSYRGELALCRVLYPRADAYVAISHPVAAEAVSRYHLDPDRVWVVPNPAMGKNPSPRRARPRASGTATLTVPARLVPQKQPVLAVETAAALRAHHGVDASVDFFGRGPEENQVRRRAEDLDVTVRFRGWVDAWFDEAADDAVVLLPSVAEGFGNVLVEAAAAGVPSVACSRALGVADAIVPNVTGILTMTASPSDLADGVVSAMTLAPLSATGWFRRFSADESGAQLLKALVAITRRKTTSGAPDARPPDSRALPGTSVGTR